MMKNTDGMKNIDDMKIGESFYLKWTVAKISERNNRPCEYDEERIDVNALIIDELEKIKADILNFIGGMNMCDDLDNETFKKLDIRIEGIFDEHISELKGE